MKEIINHIFAFFHLAFCNFCSKLELDYEDDINPYFIGDSVELVFPLLYDFF